ncbi:YggS family pyridoxal phosphate-dependent enzyme [Phocicoccus pinnipedialis]|uniref:Pyridoxal phosphate homeostasis protein n=1 Tax=Phocicoccus pinnipedialis TaxID=110845 RepID=A0A6V7RGF4_9BACL|nr:YggS family pyridoxal phosphate-dependent enzyme [Jeotgalicoccus pinnipedialis]MBP1939043.1 pyridoxal phosphate enzyme (YggS family) [Jeotgalicoccus pinnipedialis]CAD2077036.1 Pyridoxal phosphate homeostasis protein [Jeotgalicoccus pinnipedialis]
MIKRNYDQILNEIGEEVTVIAVTKYHTNDEAMSAYDAGVRNFGENRVEGFNEKREVIPADGKMHFIGTLQSRKVKDVIDDLHYLHSLERESIAKRIEQHAQHEVKCFIQVNVSGEETKHGLKPFEVKGFVESLQKYSKVKVVGLMTMAPETDDENEIRNCFVELRELRDELSKTYPSITELSMGMSNDYKIAVEEGATFIRIGSKLMGR